MRYKLSSSQHSASDTAAAFKATVADSIDDELKKMLEIEKLQLKYGLRFSSLALFAS